MNDHALDHEEFIPVDVYFNETGANEVLQMESIQVMYEDSHKLQEANDSNKISI